VLQGIRFRLKGLCECNATTVIREVVPVSRDSVAKLDFSGYRVILLKAPVVIRRMAPGAKRCPVQHA